MIKCVYKEDTAKWEASYHEKDLGQLGHVCYGETQHDAVWNLGYAMGAYPHKFARSLGEYVDSNYRSPRITAARTRAFLKGKPY